MKYKIIEILEAFCGKDKTVVLTDIKPIEMEEKENEIYQV